MVTAGTHYSVYVDGVGGSEGPYTLKVKSVAMPSCGDGFPDAGEECDPPNGTTCDAQCKVIFTEVEPNNTQMTANTLAQGALAQISPAMDEDWFAIPVAAGQTQIQIDINDLGNGACSALNLDSYVELYDSMGTMLGSDDDSGPGYCSSLNQMGVTTGTYYVRVLASSFSAMATFPYVLKVTVM
jgi:hypothetical protein